MKKVELIKKWHEKIAENGVNYSAARLEMLLESLCDTLSAELFEGGEVSLPGIGKLKSVQVPAHLKVVFRPSKIFSERLN